VLVGGQDIVVVVQEGTVMSGVQQACRVGTVVVEEDKTDVAVWVVVVVVSVARTVRENTVRC
jgi:hypothetical protein